MTTKRKSYPRLVLALAATLAACLVLSARPGSADDDSDSDRGGARFCSRTASLALAACRNEVQDDYLIASAICINISERADRRDCSREAKTARGEDSELCRDQHAARREVCDAVGEERYDPAFDPEEFATAFEGLNPYLPLVVGNRWSYEGDGETIEIEVLNETKLIDGVTCIVVNDRVFEDGDLVEDTDDWEAQAHNGDVWYCGEEVKDFETFDDDAPAWPELVSIDGSFKAGRDGDKAGLLFPAAPTPGQIYRQEFSLGNAEDVAEVLTAAYSYGTAPNLDLFVPQELAVLLCGGGDCVVTREFSPLEPDVFELKYFAPNVGMFFEVNPETRETVQLVGCNFSDKCASLPLP